MVYNSEFDHTPAQGRFRNFAFIVYPDSAPGDWERYLSDLHVPAFVAYHDQDILPTGEPKKPHYHVLVTFEGVKSISQVDLLFGFIAANGCIFVVHSLRGYARYLCHMDSPDKHQYLPESVVSFGGACYRTMVELPEDIQTLLTQILEFCVNNEITSFGQVSLYACAHRPDWFYGLQYHGALIRSTLASCFDLIKLRRDLGLKASLRAIVDANAAIALASASSPASRGQGVENPVSD